MLQLLGSCSNVVVEDNNFKQQQSLIIIEFPV